MPFAKALTLFSQLFGFFTSKATLKSHSVASAIQRSIIFLTLLSLILPPALIDIILILTPGTAKCGIGTAAQEHLLAVLAQPQGLLSIHQQEAEHHLDAQQQGVKIPVNGGLIQQLNVVAGGNPAKCGHSLAVQPPFVLAHEIIVIVVEKGGKLTLNDSVVQGNH